MVWSNNSRSRMSARDRVDCHRLAHVVRSVITPRSRKSSGRHPSDSIMTSRIRTSTYKGSFITVRWQELKRADPPGSLYIAGYALTSGDAGQTYWLQFDTPTFRSHDT